MPEFLCTYSVRGCPAGLQPESRVIAVVSVSPEKESAHRES